MMGFILLFLLVSVTIWLLPESDRKSIGLRGATSYHYIVASLVSILFIPLWTEVSFFECSLFGEDSNIESVLRDTSLATLTHFLVGHSFVSGVCEEIIFRGFLLQAFRKRCGDNVSIAASAVIFGIFHGFGPIVFATSFGFFAGYVALRSKSIFPGMVAHILVNAISIAIACLVMRGVSVVSWFVASVDGKYLRYSSGFTFLTGIGACMVFIWYLKQDRIKGE